MSRCNNDACYFKTHCMGNDRRVMQMSAKCPFPSHSLFKARSQGYNCYAPMALRHAVQMAHIQKSAFAQSTDLP